MSECMKYQTGVLCKSLILQHTLSPSVASILPLESAEQYTECIVQFYTNT